MLISSRSNLVLNHCRTKVWKHFIVNSYTEMVWKQFKIWHNDSILAISCLSWSDMSLSLAIKEIESGIPNSISCLLRLWEGMGFKFYAPASLFLLLLSLPAFAYGWGVDGHAIICQIAQVSLFSLVSTAPACSHYLPCFCTHVMCFDSSAFARISNQWEHC